jgi:hypothetical protein
VQAQAGEAQVLRHLAREVVAPVVEHVRREAHRHHVALLDRRDLEHAVVEEARVEELHLERQLLVAPEGLILLEADVAPLVVADLQEPVGNGRVRLEGVARQPLGLLDDRREVEALRIGDGGLRLGLLRLRLACLLIARFLLAGLLRRRLVGASDGAGGERNDGNRGEKAQAWHGSRPPRATVGQVSRARVTVKRSASRPWP